MTRHPNPFILSLFLFTITAGCTPAPSPTATSPSGVATPLQRPQTPAPMLYVVTSSDDAGAGTLRQAIEDATAPVVISFDPSVFPPDSPVTIRLSSGLPELRSGNLTIDASNAGVILDGSNITTPESGHGISISSDNNIVRGLQIVGFSDAGIGLRGGAQHNIIGGDRKIGDAPLGQANLISGNGNFGVGLWEETTSHNTITGNYIGITLDGTAAWGHARDGIHSNGATLNLISGNVIGGNGAAGVYLCCVLNGRNVITENLIGVGPSGSPLGNHLSGVVIDRTSHNVVGPANTIAHNIGEGILFAENTLSNTVTQNSIRDNTGRGIVRPSAGDSPIQPPSIIIFDLEAGTLAGVACPNCTVEIYSDGGDEAAIYEGRAAAEANGAFAFAKGNALIGPVLTATATDSDGTTTELSSPTQGNSQTLLMQEGNAASILPLQTRPSAELADNRIGGVAHLPYSVDLVTSAGLKWMRLAPDPSGRWQHVDWETDQYAIDPEEEREIDELVSNGVKIMLVLDVWFPESRTVFHKSEEDIALYLSWVRSMVRHFKGRIEYYEILNEPDLNFEAPSGMPVDAYVNLIKRTVPVIREEDPEAKIVVGAVPDTRFDHVRDWMWGLLNSEAMPLVDGFSWHGMYGAAPSDDPRGVRGPEAPQMANYWENYPSLVGEIMRVAASAGFKGEYLVEEMIWRTPAYPHETEPDGFTDMSGAKYLARAIIIHLGLNVTTGVAVVPEDVGPRSHSVTRALSTVMAGARVVDLPVEIESTATNIKSYGFALPNGETVVALWSDGAAVDDDPSVKTALTIQGLSAKRAVGIDVLNGIEQELLTKIEGGNLVIRNLLVRDYPIIIRLTP